MTELISSSGASISFGVLTISGISHLINIDHFRDALREQGLWKGLEPTVVYLVVAVEVLIGAAGFMSIATLMPASFALQLPLAASALYFAYMSFSIYLVKKRPGAPCACAGNHVATIWTTVRAAALFACSLAGAAGSHSDTPLGVGGYEGALSILTACALGVLIWSLPELMAEPLQITRRGPRLKTMSEITR